jgi:hypothetical protein
MSLNHPFFILALMMTTLPAAATSALPRDALTDGRLGLYDAQDFQAVRPPCADCNAAPQALWYFESELVALPLRDPAGFDAARPAQDDVRNWAQSNRWQPDAQHPSPVWLGSPHIAQSARLDRDGRTITWNDGTRAAFSLVPQLPSNVSWFNADSVAWLQGQPLTLRGTLGGGDFTARTLWPGSFDIDPAA